MNHLGPRRQTLGRHRRQTRARLEPREVLHRHRLAGAQERPVKDRGDAQIGRRVAVGRDAEAPRLDPLLPAAEDECDIARAAALVGIAALRTLKPLVSPDAFEADMVGSRTRAAIERELGLAPTPWDEVCRATAENALVAS